MFSDPLAITYNGASKSLVRVNQDSYGSDYSLDDGQQKFKLTIRHTIPPRGKAGESHMMRLDVEQYDTDGAYVRTDSSWTVVKTFDKPQVSADALLAGNALVGLATSANIAKILSRES